ncbi:aldo/keto reductase [Streptomyces polyrhachis]|uniref:Aldo/keto reductase n=1 Tax=Streptomyces polyrhachis TaxID=1282885 RepID=A0ABW2GL54_9ACTN
MHIVPSITLNNGVAMPQLGFGVWQVPDAGATAAVSEALEVGYRSIDTAEIYENERGTGRALASSGIAREDLFVTTKLWNTAKQAWDRDAVLRAFDASLERLGLDYVDLYLIHWPRALRDDYVTIWRVFGEIAQSGRARAVGVSNFKPQNLERLIEEAGLTPAVNQIELHPYFQQAELRAFDQRHGIATESWSPLGQGKDVLADETIGAIAAAHGVTPAQAVIRWHLQLGNIVIPKSVTPARIKENFDVFDFELSPEEMAAIAGLETGKRLGPDPDDFDVD